MGERESATTSILLAAVEEFGHQGFEGANIADIALRAGVARPLVHYHFKTKDQLWYAAVKHAMTSLQNEIVKLAFELRGMDPVEALKLGIRKYAYFCGRNPSVARMMLSEIVRDTERARWVRATYIEPSYQMFEGLQQMVVASGRFKAIHPGYILPILNGAISAFAADRGVLRKRYGIDTTDSKVIENYAEFVMDALLNGLLIRPSSG